MTSQGELPSPAELENLGVLFVGFIASTFLYGLTFFQSYIYFTRYPNDHKWTRVLAGSLGILDTASTALVTYVLYDYLIKMFDEDLEVLSATSTSCAQSILSSVLTLITQLFFAGRLHTVCGGPASLISRMVALTVCFLAFITFVFGLTSVGQTFRQRQLSAMTSPPMVVVAGISQGFAAAANITIFVAMSWSLRPVRYPDMLMPEGVLENVVGYISRGLGLTIIQLACFGAFVASPAKPYWIAMQMVTCRICANTLLGLLNTRGVRRGIGFNAEDTQSDRNDSTNDGLPTLRFRQPTNTKTQQTVTYSRQEMDSGGTDIEEASKPSQHDETMSSARSHCSEQPEDKTRLSSELMI